MQKEFIRLDSYKKNSCNNIPEIGDAMLKVGDVSPVIPLIAEKLMTLGYLPRMEHASGIYSSLSPDLLTAINSFRIRNNMPAGKVIGANTIDALNRPLSFYKERLAVNMERMRWQKKMIKEVNM